MIEFTPDIEEILDQIEEADDTKLSALHQHIVSVVESTRLLEDEGLFGFWTGTTNQEVIMKSFDTIGAYELNTLFQSSQWCENKSADQELNEVETSHLEDIESELLPLLEDVPDILQEFLDDEI